MFKKNIVIGVGAVVAVLMIGGFFFRGQAFETQKSNSNMVIVEVKPVELVAGKPATFDIRLDTHSVDLGYDMVKAGLLRDSQERTYTPETWKGSPPGGHHRSGVLEFPTLEGNPSSVTLTLKDIGGVPERSFQWKMAK